MTETTLATTKPAESMRLATDAAGLCKSIAVSTSVNIQGRKYVKVEGWQAIATAHGCVASARDVERIESGLRSIGEVRRIDNGTVIATAEGFVGDDEPTWVKRPEYARRAMCQTRAISRACRSAFAHVVVLMNAGLETTPAEEVPHDGFPEQGQHEREPRDVTPPAEQAEPSQPAKPTPRASRNDDGQDIRSVVGQYARVYHKQGGPPDRPWSKHSVKIDSTYYSTFDKDVAEALNAHCDVPVELRYKVDAKGFCNVVEVLDAPADGLAADADQPEQEDNVPF